MDLVWLTKWLKLTLSDPIRPPKRPRPIEPQRLAYEIRMTERPMKVYGSWMVSRPYPRHCKRFSKPAVAEAPSPVSTTLAFQHI